MKLRVHRSRGGYFYRIISLALLVARLSAADAVFTSDIPTVNPQVPILEGVFALADEHYFAIAMIDSSGKKEKATWVKLGEALGDFTPTRFDLKSETLFIKERTGHIYTLRLADGHVKSSKLPPLSRELALQKLNAMISELIEQKLKLKTPLALDLNVESHISPEKSAQIAKNRAIVEQVRGRIFLVGWTEEVGLSSFQLPDITKSLPHYLTAPLTKDDLEIFSAKWTIAVAELDVSRLYDKEYSKNSAK